MVKHTIECLYQGVVKNTINVGQAESFDGTLIVVCDGEQDNNSFTLEEYGDSNYIIQRNRCEINVKIQPNLTPYYRNVHLIFTHAEDTEVFTTVDIIQEPQDFSIDLLNLPYEYVNINNQLDVITQNEYDELNENDKLNYDKRYILKLKKEIDFTNPNRILSNYNYYEDKEVNVSVIGGNEKYKLKSIVKYHIEQGDETIVTQSDFDNGFIYTLYDDKFVIRSYGMPFMDINDYYEFSIYHDKYKPSYIRLKIVYKETNTRSSSRKLTKNTIENVEIKPQVSEIYLPKKVLKELYSRKEEINSNDKYELVFLEDFGNEYVIEGSSQITYIHFKTLLNEEEHNFYIKTFSSARWCSIYTDNTNTKLKIQINDEPISTRKSIIKVNIANHPETMKTFVLTNKKSPKK